MAYGDEINKKNEESLARQRATRERRAQEKQTNDLRKEALGRVRSQSTISTKDIREIKTSSEEELLSMLGRSSAGGNARGGIYDISTDNYSQPNRNQTNQDVSTEEAGIDTLGGSGPSDGDGDSGFPEGYVETSVTICIDGTPTAGTILFKAS